LILDHARVIQGAAGGALQPISQAVLMESFASETRMACRFHHGHCVAPNSGPIIGGWLTYNYSWRWPSILILPSHSCHGALSRFSRGSAVFETSSAANIDTSASGLLAFGSRACKSCSTKVQARLVRSKMIVWCAVIAIGRLHCVYRARIVTAESDVDLRILQKPQFCVGNV